MDQRKVLEQFRKAQRQLVLQSADLSLGTLSEMVENKAIDLAPAFQRRDRWDLERQSALIESFLLNVPVPPVYLARATREPTPLWTGSSALRPSMHSCRRTSSFRALNPLGNSMVAPSISCQRKSETRCESVRICAWSPCYSRRTPG